MKLVNALAETPAKVVRTYSETGTDLHFKSFEAKTKDVIMDEEPSFPFFFFFLWHTVCHGPVSTEGGMPDWRLRTGDGFRAMSPALLPSRLRFLVDDTDGSADAAQDISAMSRDTIRSSLWPDNADSPTSGEPEPIEGKNRREAQGWNPDYPNPLSIGIFNRCLTFSPKQQADTYSRGSIADDMHACDHESTPNWIQAKDLETVKAGSMQQYRV